MLRDLWRYWYLNVHSVKIVGDDARRFGLSTGRTGVGTRPLRSRAVAAATAATAVSNGSAFAFEGAR